MSPQPWERQEGEPEKAYRAFCAYRDLPRRSLANLAEATGISKSAITKQSARWSWVARVTAFDDHLSATAVEAAESSAQEGARLREAACNSALRIVCAYLKQIEEGEKTPTPRDLKDMAAFLDTAVKLSSFVHGGATERVEARVETFADLSLNDVFGVPELRAYYDRVSRETNLSHKGSQ